MNKTWIPIQINKPNIYDEILVYKRGGKIEGRIWRDGEWRMDDTHWMLAPARPNDFNLKNKAINKINDLIEYILEKQLASNVLSSYMFLKSIQTTLNYGNKLEVGEIEKIEKINEYYGRIE